MEEVRTGTYPDSKRPTEFETTCVKMDLSHKWHCKVTYLRICVGRENVKHGTYDRQVTRVPFTSVRVGHVFLVLQNIGSETYLPWGQGCSIIAYNIICLQS